MNESKNETIIEIYKTLLSQEVTNHTIVVTILLGITIILIGVTWWWNKQGAKRIIEKEVKKKFELEKKLIITQIQDVIDSKLKDQEKRLLAVEANTARSIGISAVQQKAHNYAAGWFANYSLISLKIDNHKGVRASVDIIIEQLKLIDDEYVFSLDSLNEVTEKLPDYLAPEKKQIKRLIKGKKDINKKD